MKPATFGCVLGSAAALVFNGCAGWPVAATAVYGGAGEPVFVEQRAIMIDRQVRTVPIYRTGDAYFYTWSGRRYTLDDYPERIRYVRGPGPAYSTARYRSWDRDWDWDRDWGRDDRREARRAARRLNLDDF